MTGMSGTGKSTLIRELVLRGYKASDTDYDGWSHWLNVRAGQGNRGAVDYQNEPSAPPLEVIVERVLQLVRSET